LNGLKDHGRVLLKMMRLEYYKLLNTKRSMKSD